MSNINGPIRIGIDFDNTIICYDGVFHKIAYEKGLIPETLPEGKNSVRDYLRKQDKEDEWTRLQGLIYGTRLAEAKPFPGVMDFFSYATATSDIQVYIVSHKTKKPYLGPEYDLHKAADDWILTNNLFHSQNGQPTNKSIFFELTKEEKIERINALKCDVFIDDLPEFLSLPGFRPDIRKVLFDPDDKHPEDPGLTKVNSWITLLAKLKNSQL